ncbi:NAD-dependent deacetylase [Azonexus sp.]|uniref:SIR2 family NAD-dependent protein deacylase n=1 Tax=Azonexus sp. TaxID=1872668 RepID=UPI0035AE3480
MTPNDLDLISQWISTADSLVIAAGAGMGVDSGLPDFRGNEGFWQAYPALGQAGMDFAAIANGETFVCDPLLAWGFYGHRLKLYRASIPHEGFRILKQIGERLEHGCFVVSSNVDGQFQKAGFSADHILEIHGSIHHLQCTQPCSSSIWSADSLAVATDDANCRWSGEKLPTCPQCGGIARPNILMFNDLAWDSARTDRQQRRWDTWLTKCSNPVVIEIGAGVDLPSIRAISSSFKRRVIRINPRHAAIDRRLGVGLAMGAREALVEIARHLTRTGFLPAAIDE